MHSYISQLKDKYKGKPYLKHSESLDFSERGVIDKNICQDYYILFYIPDDTRSGSESIRARFTNKIFGLKDKEYLFNFDKDQIKDYPHIDRLIVACSMMQKIFHEDY